MQNKVGHNSYVTQNMMFCFVLFFQNGMQEVEERF